ncbi:S-layer homology domain-containing protein [Paenibacillus wynnii]|uniref:S-layer homology domain-containing protein n=1 Tax=Paenibacillus wynnii TaxID=268407 RepID=UPI00278EDC70|nr:S-layer homology domain-containing protein [Paenibacillus wynnii]MDQ0194124.1 chitodextrinase [Paenibacillus wynnii]
MRNLLLIIVLLFTTLLIPITPVTHAAGITHFSDISSKHWAQREIERLQEQNVIGGYSDGTFRPDLPITRAEAVKIIVETSNIDLSQEVSLKPSHSDVPTSYWAFPYIEAAEKHALITGYADGSFRPVATLTRADSAVLIARAFELNTPSSTTIQPNDIAGDHWAASSISKLISNGVAVGDSNGNFQPAKMVSRSEFAALLARTLYKEFRLEPAEEKYLMVQKPKSDDKVKNISLPLPSPSPTPSPSPDTTGLGTAGAGSGGVSIPLPQPAPIPTMGSKPVQTPIASPSIAPVHAEISGLQASIKETSLSLTWVNPNDGSFKKVNIYKEGSKVASTPGTSHEESGLSPSTSYSFTFKTVDKNNLESAGKTMSFTTATSEPPSSPEELVAVPDDGAIQLQWKSNLESNLSGYNVYLDGLQYNTTSVTEATYVVKGLKNGVTYNVFVTTLNTLSKESEPSATINVVPGLPDILAPEEVSGFASTDNGTSISMTWNNPLDPDFVRTDLYQHDVLIGSSTQGSFTVKNLVSETEYEYVLKTVDSSNNTSKGISVSIRTKDITPPAVPANVSAVGGPSSITFSWAANTELDLAGYNIYVNDTMLNTEVINQVSYELGNLEFGKMYNLTLEAVDTNGNISKRSEIATFTPSHHLIERSRWGIYNDGTHPIETTKGINNALIWAYQQGITATTLTPGTYLIDKASQINMVPNMLFDLPKEVILQKETNDKESYQIVALDYGDDNVTLRGGTYIGDRLTHDYSKKDHVGSAGTHEFGYGIIARGVKNLVIDGVKTTQFTGDGIILAGHGTLVDIYEQSFVSGSVNDSGQTISDASKTRTKVMQQLTNPIFQKEPYFELMNPLNLPGKFDIYFYTSNGTFHSKLADKNMRDIIDIPQGVTQFHLVFAKSTHTGAYVEYWNRALTRDSVIMNSESAFNRRQGISLIGSNNIVIKNNILHDIKGIAPQSGIDLEGGYGENGDLVMNTTIQNNEFFNNASYDLILYDGHHATVEGNHFASKGVIGLAVSPPFQSALVKGNHFDGTRILAYHDTTLLNNRMNDSNTFFEGPNIIVDGLDITNGTLSVTSKTPFGVTLSNVNINITKSIDAGLRIWNQPIHLTNVTVTGAGSIGTLSGGVAEGSIFDNLQMIGYNSNNGISLPAGTYNNSVFQAAEGYKMGSPKLGAGKYIFNNCTFTSNTTGNTALYGENAALDLTVRNSTFNVLGDAIAISIQTAKKVVFENNTIQAMKMVRTNLELIKINDYWKRNDPYDVLNVTINNNTITSNIAAIGISTIYAGTGAPPYLIQNNTLNKAILSLKANDLQSLNILNK